MVYDETTPVRKRRLGTAPPPGCYHQSRGAPRARRDRMARSRSALPVSIAACTLVVAAAGAAVPGGGAAPAAQPPAAGVTVVSPAGRSQIDTVDHDGHAMIALGDLARLFPIELDEDSRTGALSLVAGDAVIILTPDQQLVSVDGRLVSLRAAPRRVGGRWLAPLDFLDRALAPAYPEPLEFRSQSRLLIAGGLRVPRVAARYLTGVGDDQLRLEVTPATEHTIDERADRLVVTFEADDLDLVRLPRLRGDLATAFERTVGSPGVAVRFGRAFDSYGVFSEPARNGGATLVIELRGVRAAAGAAPAPTPPRPAPAPADPLPDFSRGPAVRMVAIDPGHGGADSGSRGPNGVLEKDVTLGVAQRLRSMLENRLGLRVVLTRERDETVDLDTRTAIANSNKADLFISLHANASARPAATGTEVFYLGIDEYGAEAQELAERDVQPVPVVGGGSRRIDPVLWETAQILYVERSARLAGVVEAELRQRVAMSPRPVQPAPFRVLVGANMPAVLVELGSLASPEHERRLAGERFRNAVADALLAGIRRFGDELERGGPASGLPPGA